MNSFERLQEQMIRLEKETNNKGYYYIISNALTIMICGMLCNLQNISDIYDWEVDSIQWLPDVHFQKDKTKIWDMNIQKNLNIVRKIALNPAGLYKNSYEPCAAISGLLKAPSF